MKRNLIFSGLIALIVSLSAMGIITHFRPEKKTITIEHVNTIPSQKAVFTVDDNGKAIPLDFNETASSVLDGVVHIKSTTLHHNTVPSSDFQSIPDPFRDFFGDQFKKEFFFPNGGKSKSHSSPARVGSGSGVIISKDGYIVTNNHVIDRADDIDITLHDNRTYKAIVVGADPSTDIALLKIKESNLPTVPLTNSDHVKIGQWVMAVGNPMGLNSTVTAGIISAKGRNINILKDKYAVENFIQTDAAINPGNSGGALVNLNGALIGINTAIASPTGSFAGYGFAVPSNIVQKVVEDLMEFGVVQRGALGIMIKTVNSTLAREKNINISKGIYIDSILQKSAAQNAGLKVGDIITKVDELSVNTSSELQAAIAQHRPGEKVDIYINRSGKEQMIPVTLYHREGNTEELSKESGKALKILGARIENTTPDQLADLDIESGVIVQKIFPGKIRKQTQMRDNFIITHIDNKKIENMNDLLEHLEDKEGGIMLEGVYTDIPGKYYYALGL